MDKSQFKLKMYDLVEQWLSSGQSQNAWCREQGVARSTFGRWRQKYEQDHGGAGSPNDLSSYTSPGFVSIEVPGSGQRYQVTYPNGVQLQCPSETSLADLRSLIHLLD